MDYVKIDGITYDVCVVSIEETFNVLDSDKSGRSVSGTMIRDIIGTYIGHKVTFRRRQENLAEYDSLYDKLMQPVDSHYVELAHNQTTISYRAYVTKGGRKLKHIDPTTNKIYWDEFTAEFIAMGAYLTP